MLVIFLNMIESLEDKRLLETVYNNNHKKMFSIAYHILKNKEDSEDAVFDVFKSVAERMSILSAKLTNETQWVNYLNMSVHNRALNIIRSNQKQTKIHEKAILNYQNESDDDFINKIETKFEYEILSKAIDQLPVNYKLVIYQRFVMELSYEEIAKINKTKKSTVNQQITRGKKLLFNILKENTK